MSYIGNKNIAGLIQKIVNQIPECTDVYELFAGSAAVSKYLSVRCTGNVKFHINDIDRFCIDSFIYPSGSLLTSVPAVDIINSLKTVAPGNMFIFLDPPYLHCTRNNNHLYDHEMSNKDHEELLMSVQDLKHNCMIVHPVTDLYDEMLCYWRKVIFKVRYNNKTSIEALYMNYPRPVKLLTYVVAGNDCWDRQRIKRKGDRLINKLMNLPVIERNYILNRLEQLR